MIYFLGIGGGGGAGFKLRGFSGGQAGSSPHHRLNEVQFILTLCFIFGTQGGNCGRAQFSIKKGNSLNIIWN